MRAAVDPELDEGTGVDEEVDALARGQLAALVLAGDGAGAAGLPCLLPPPAELRDALGDRFGGYALLAVASDLLFA